MRPFLCGGRREGSPARFFSTETLSGGNDPVTQRGEGGPPRCQVRHYQGVSVRPRALPSPLLTQGLRAENPGLAQHGLQEPGIWGSRGCGTAHSHTHTRSRAHANTRSCVLSCVHTHAHADTHTRACIHSANVHLLRHSHLRGCTRTRSQPTLTCASECA